MTKRNRIHIRIDDATKRAMLDAAIKISNETGVITSASDVMRNALTFYIANRNREFSNEQKTPVEA